MTGEATITLGYTPVSLNQGGMRAHHLKQYRLKHGLQRDLEALLMAERLPRGMRYVTASASLRFPVRRRRDEGNFRWLLEKALGDALVNGGWLPDDTPANYRFATVTFEPEPGPPRTMLSLIWRAQIGGGGPRAA